jgi:hypothetical protein
VSGEGRFSRRGGEARRGKVLNIDESDGGKGEKAVEASLSLLSWLLKSGVPRGGAVRGGEVFLQGCGGAGGGRFLTTTGAKGAKGR